MRREIGDRVGMGWSLAIPALTEGRLGHFAEAERLWRERIAVGEEMDNPALVALSYAHISHKVYFIVGDFTQARATAEKAIRLGSRIDMATARGWALPTLSLLASMDENYDEARQLCQQALPVRGHADIAKLAAWGLAIASCGLEDYEAARDHLSAASNYLTTVLGPVGTIVSLPIVAIILTHRDQPVWAVELLALAFTHPVGASAWMEKWPLLNRLRVELEQMLGTEAYQTAWESGTGLDLEEVVAELRQRFPGVYSTFDEKGKQLLVEPLTERELEVLRLLSDGLSNREIAQSLILAEGTIKWYSTQIYGKLGVRNRSQAVRRAQQLQLFD